MFVGKVGWLRVKNYVGMDDYAKDIRWWTFPSSSIILLSEVIDFLNRCGWANGNDNVWRWNLGELSALPCWNSENWNMEFQEQRPKLITNHVYDCEFLYVKREGERQRKERGNLATRGQIFWSSRSDALEQILKERKIKYSKNLIEITLYQTQTSLSVRQLFFL